MSSRASNQEPSEMESNFIAKPLAFGLWFFGLWP
jgi:hypothetical protein